MVMYVPVRPAPSLKYNMDIITCAISSTS
jgi:hypothetical protein